VTKGEIMQTNHTLTKKSNSSKSPRRFVATVAMVAAVAFAASAAAPTVSAAHAKPVPGGCDDWGCGTNHNEVMATATSL
jgi:Spy/CpxP family protein refolding chaperone